MFLRNNPRQCTKPSKKKPFLAITFPYCIIGVSLANGTPTWHRSPFAPRPSDPQALDPQALDPQALDSQVLDPQAHRPDASPRGARGGARGGACGGARGDARGAPCLSNKDDRSAQD